MYSWRIPITDSEFIVNLRQRSFSHENVENSFEISEKDKRKQWWIHSEYSDKSATSWLIRNINNGLIVFLRKESEFIVVSRKNTGVDSRQR